MDKNDEMKSNPEEPAESSKQNEMVEKAETSGALGKLEGLGEFKELEGEYPDAARAGEAALPEEVLKLKAQGLSLLEAYRLYDLKKTKVMLEQLKQKYEAEAANRAAAAAATGSVAGGQTHVKDYYTSQEWDRLPDDIRQRFIKNGKIFEFMKKWSDK